MSAPPPLPERPSEPRNVYVSTGLPVADCPASAPTVEVPVRSAIRSREAWLFGISGVLTAILAALSELPPEVLVSFPWAAAVVKLMIGLSAVAGLLARLSRPDIASGVPWLDRSTQAALTKRGEIKEPRT